MPNIALTNDELNTIIAAINTELKTAKRAQNNAKLPQLADVHRNYEVTLTDLGNKLIKAAVQK